MAIIPAIGLGQCRSPFRATGRRRGLPVALKGDLHLSLADTMIKAGLPGA